LEWDALLQFLSTFKPDPHNKDHLLWRWSNSGKFTVKSFYQWLEFGGMVNHDFDTIWEAKIPWKIKIFLWLLKRNRVLTKENLIKRGWQGNPKCQFCDDFESTEHLFITCPFVNQIWIWIALHNNFVFQCHSIADLWLLDAAIPLKDKPIIELIRGVVLWSIWIERNRLCFQNGCISTLKSFGAKIISLASFWCKSLNNNSYLKLSLLMPLNVDLLPHQVGEMGAKGVETDIREAHSQNMCVPDFLEAP
jgi:hypothetical protein